MPVVRSSGTSTTSARRMVNIALPLVPTASSRSLAQRAIAVAGGLGKRCSTLGAVPGERYASITRSEEHTSELQSLMRISYAVFWLQKKQNFVVIFISDLLHHLLFINILVMPQNIPNIKF